MSLFGQLRFKKGLGSCKRLCWNAVANAPTRESDDYVIATGNQYSVRDFVNTAAKRLDFEIEWKGEGLDEKGFLPDGKCIIAVDKGYFRPAEVDTLLGDPTKAKEKLKWEPKVTFEELVYEMVDEDLKEAKNEEALKASRRSSLF